MCESVRFQYDSSHAFKPIRGLFLKYAKCD